MPAAREPLLEIAGLGVAYRTRRGEAHAVTGFDLRIAAGEAVGLVGESGCGKSTVAFAIMRHLGANGRITGGAIRFLGRDLLRLDDREMRRLRGAEIAMVYQEATGSLNPTMTVGRQLAEVPIWHEGVDAREARARALALLAEVQLPDPERIYASYPHELSGGQQQRVVIAMALLGAPRLLLLDEPTTALDVTVEAAIVDLVKDLAARRGMALLFISHDLGLVERVCDRIAVMYAGEIVEEAKTERIFRAPRHPYTRALLRALPLAGSDRRRKPLEPIPGSVPSPLAWPTGCRFAPRCPHHLADICDAHPPLLEPDSGHRVRCPRHADIPRSEERQTAPLPEPAIGASVLEVRGLSKSFLLSRGGGVLGRFARGRRRVQANVALDLDARQGETVAIVGESGSGKSTFARILLGLETADSGAVRFEGRDLAQLPVRGRPRELLARLQMVFQNPFDTLNPSQRVGRQILRALARTGGGGSRRELRRRALALLRAVQLAPDIYDRRPAQLSGGQKQRVAIARAFAGEPALVVADEPTSALDVSVQAAIVRLLADIQLRNRTTLLFISHDLALVRHLADRVVVLYLGRVVEAGPVARVFDPPYHPYTEALLSAAPVPGTGRRARRIILEGDMPSPSDPPSGCPFHPRCHRRLGAICRRESPPLRRLGGGHVLRCHLSPEELARMRPVFAGAES